MGPAGEIGPQSGNSLSPRCQLGQSERELAVLGKSMFNLGIDGPSAQTKTNRQWANVAVAAVSVAVVVAVAVAHLLSLQA